MLLYCFPHAGGASTTYRSWQRLLPVGIVVCPMSYATVGLSSGADLPAAAAVLADRIGADPAEPVAFFGHSMGALVAFEVARTLRARGRRGPVALVAAGHVAPHVPAPGPVLHGLPSDDFWREVRTLGGGRDDLIDDPELRAAVESRVRSEFRAAETYRYTPSYPLDCDVLAIVGAEDDRSPVEGMREWRMHTLGGFTMNVLPGGHFFVDAYRHEVLMMIQAALAATGATGRTGRTGVG
ncbi:alpha/beta fold hydrolase [Micromonospora sp. WMMA1947]|uniref:thioesterase II family protein n=1 Tax=Micromonospora sp. WMMA1947 TaxID=3015163 RepID=UPI00248BA07E|nr:alpha/beta fold hydrolase [Micromonospora sp. WMMA1947]WBC07467.1 alpha/beta fold hydrolase [Micromonospora sp. WMMA1947]